MKTVLCLLFVVFINVVASASVKRHVKKKKSAESILRDVKHHLDEAERLTKEVHDDQSPQVVELADSIGEELARLGNWVNDVETPEYEDDLEAPVEDVKDVEVPVEDVKDIESPVEEEKNENEEALMSLEDSLEQAIAEDEKKSQSTNEKKELSNKLVNKLFNLVKEDVKKDSPTRYIAPYPADKMFGDEMEDNKVEEKKDTLNKDHKQKDAESQFKFGVHPDRPVKDDQKMQDVKPETGVHPDRPQHITKMLQRKKDVAEMKKLVKGINNDFGKMKENFQSMKNIYYQAVKDGKLADIQSNVKLGEVRLDMKGIRSSLQALKDMLPKKKEGNTKRGVESREGFNKAKNFVGIIQDQIGATAEAVNDMMNLVSQPKEDIAEHNEDDNNNDLVELEHMRDEMKGITTRIKQRLTQKDAPMTKGLKKEIVEMRKDYNEIKEKIEGILKRL